MRIESIELRRVELVLNHDVATATGTHSVRPVLLVALETDEGTGIGECSALAAPIYTSEYADGAETHLRDVVLPFLVHDRGVWTNVEGAMEDLKQFGEAPMALAGVEMAMLDVELRATGQSLASFLGATVSRIPGGATVGIGSVGDVLAQVRVIAGASYRRVKLKITPGNDYEVVAEVRREFPTLQIAVDANGAYASNNAHHRAILQEIAELGLVLIEQPFPKDDLLGHAMLREAIDVPIVLDESITTRHELDRAIATAAMDGVSLKSARLGGLLATKAMHDRCVDAGLSLCVGGMFESGVGRAAAIAVGAMSGCNLPGDIGASEQYFSRELTAPHVLVDGYLAVPTGPGLGVTLDQNNIEDQTVRLHTFHA